MKKLPFEITPQIKRYLDKLLVFSEQYPSGEHDCVIETFSEGEKKTEYSLNNATAFVKYMEGRGIIKYNEVRGSYSHTDYDDNVVSDTEHKDDGYPTEWRAYVLDKNMLKNIADFADVKTGVALGENGVRWNRVTRILSYPNSSVKYKFQKKSELNCELFDILWKNKKHVVSRNIESIGTPQKAIDVAEELGFNRDARREKWNDTGIKQTITLARDVIKAIRKKGFGVFLTQKEGLLMTLKE